MKEITKNTYFKWYHNMIFWRKFEDKCRSLYIKEKIRGFLHLYNGQEAIPAGIAHVMNMSKDRMITGYRCHILPMALGVDPKKIMAELYGKVTGTSCGMGGSMHIFSKEHRFYGGHGIVGGQIPLGAGIAFADKYFNRNAVTFTLMGDGAVRQGSLHESLNLAVLWKLPVIFICENNLYAMGTSVKRSTSLTDLYKIGISYNIHSAPVDGMNPIKIAEAVYEALVRARNGKGPTFLELKTYRFRGHSMSDAEPYRNKEEIENYKKKDPILFIKNHLLNNNLANKETLKVIEEEAKKSIDECVEFAENSDFPPIENMYNMVYSNDPFAIQNSII